MRNPVRAHHQSLTKRDKLKTFIDDPFGLFSRSDLSCRNQRNAPADVIMKNPQIVRSDVPSAAFWPSGTVNVPLYREQYVCLITSRD